MEIRRHGFTLPRFFGQFFILILLLLFAMPVFAEEVAFPQKLEWKSNANALEYKIEVQNIASGKSQFITTDKTSTEISLTPGKYRYRVHAYDFLGREASVSSWTNFEVFKANRPDIRNVEKNVQIQKETGGVGIDVNIGDINKASKFELVNESLEGAIAPEEKSRMGNSSSETENITHLDFKNVPPGKWRLRVTNASGLSSLSEVISVEGEKTYSEDEVALIKKEAEDAVREEMKASLDDYIKKYEDEKKLAELARENEEANKKAEEERLAEEERNAKELLEQQKREAKEAEKRAKAEWKAAHPYKWKDVIFEGGFGLSVNVFGKTIKNYYDDNGSLALSLRLKYLPVKIGSEKFGAELGFMTQQYTRESEYYEGKLETNNFDAKMVWQHKIFEKMYVSAKVGGGITLIEKSIEYSMATTGRVSPEVKEYYYPLAVAGASVFFYPWKFLVFETGVDFTCIFAGKPPLGFVTPYACVGFRF